MKTITAQFLNDSYLLWTTKTFCKVQQQLVSVLHIYTAVYLVTKVDYTPFKHFN